MIPGESIQWRGQIDPLLCGLLVLLVGLGLWWGHRLLARRSRHPWRMFWPKVAVTLLLVLVLFEPVWTVRETTGVQGSLLVLVDTSASMAVADDGKSARLERARKIVEGLRGSMSEGVTLDVREFDTGVRKAGEGAPPGAADGTDIGGSLALLEQGGELSSAVGVVLLTDGGDEALDEVRAPPVPVHVVGIGAAPDGWDDIAIEELQAPATVEKEAAFDIEVGLSARAADAAFAGRLGAVEVRIEAEGDEAAEPLASQRVDLSRGRAKLRFRLEEKEPGLRRYRARAVPLEGELSGLNNARPFAVNVQKRSLHVLYFTRELGVEFKALRSELGRDPGIAFTALFRTVSERFTIQGDRFLGDEVLAGGFPRKGEGLALFDCIMIGSFDAAEWRADQMKALVDYVEAGGGVIFLGGEKSFSGGGYGGTVLGPLFPWRIEEGEASLLAGTFPVSIGAAGSGHPVVAGLDRAFSGGPGLASVNLPGPLRPGALALVEAQVRDRPVAVVAVQSFGQGRVLGVASNTLWQWTRAGEVMKLGYGVFWRQAVRFLAGKTEGGKVLTVSWDKERYRPGEAAVATVRLGADRDAEGVRLSPALTFGGENRPLSIEAAGASRRVSTVQMRFGGRGTYSFRLSAYEGEQLLEAYEKEIPVEALLPEGSRLELDPGALGRLAERSGGAYVEEAEAVGLGKDFAARLGQRTVAKELPLAQAGPYFVIVVLALLALEWWVRRRSNLV
jgi:uncharacterized membrane protein